MRRDFTLPEQGAATQVWAAVSPDLADVGSVYLADCAVRDDVVPYAVDEKHALELWELSERPVRVGGRVVNRMDRRKMRGARPDTGCGVRTVPVARRLGDHDRRDLHAADVANRTFFNHFPTRQDMMRALAESRLLNLHDVIVDRSSEPVPARLVGLFDDIATVLVKSSDTYREVIAEMLASSGYGIQRGFALHDTFLELVKEGVARGEVGVKHDAQTLADIIVGALTGGIVNWTVDRTYSLETGLHDLGRRTVRSADG